MNKPTAARLDSRDFTRIARAIRYIDANYTAQPRLSTLAAAVNLSEFHFNRLFRRWAGITPRQYLAVVTARAAQGALLGTPSVLEAALSVGLSGPGRLHDLMVTLEAVTPGELKAGGAGIILTGGFAATPFGCALLARTARGLSHLSFVEAGSERAALAGLLAQWPHARWVRDDAAAEAVAGEIWGAHPRRRSLRLAVRGTNFQLKVWAALLATASAQPTTYAQLARAAGSPGAARAVGQAVGANPVAWLIPCHNVLKADGTLGQYHWGPDRKRAMLAWQELTPAPAMCAAASARTVRHAT